MNLNGLNVVTKKLSRQVEAYNAVGRDPVMEIPLIFAANPEHFFNIKAFNDAGIDVLGFARQADQKFLENIGGILSQKVKTALDNSTALPDQDVVDAVVSSYDFTGARATSEESMSTNNRIIVAEIRKELRRIIKVGIFAQLDASGNKTNNPNDVTFNAERVQTGPEAKGEKKTPPNSVPFENFNEVVIAAFNSVPAELEDGNVWNTMPAHTHQRRSEVYMYFNLKPESFVVHLTGSPEETRHLIIRDRQAVLSTSWSMHAGAGTQSYSFIWAMGGENQVFDDMDGIPMSELK